MTSDAHVILESWSAPIGVNVSLCLAALVYTRGWLRLHKFFPNLISTWRLAVFFAGIVSVWIAVGSPLEAFDEVSLSVHMVQHLLLMAVAPPLILLGAPTLPLLRGLPRMIRCAVGGFLRWPLMQRLGRVLTNPTVCCIVASVAVIAWHIRILAQNRACLFFRNFTLVLVARNPALSQCCEMARLVHSAISISRDAARRRTGSFPHIL